MYIYTCAYLYIHVCIHNEKTDTPTEISHSSCIRGSNRARKQQLPLQS